MFVSMIFTDIWSKCLWFTVVLCLVQIEAGTIKIGLRNAKVLQKPSLFDSDLLHDRSNAPETSAEFWRHGAQATLQQHLHVTQNTNVAKNVIFFLGDGMSLPTVVAARTYLGQSQGKKGEETRLSFEDFPYIGLSKTYCIDKQTADSACSATAYLCGVKANYETIGVNGQVDLNDCPASLLPTNRVSSIVSWAQKEGKRTGVVTTTRITHASPSGAYAHTANRNWESDADFPPNVTECVDIAQQLVLGETGRNLNVIFGGGRKNFVPATVTDEDGVTGVRKDGRNLIDEWLKVHQGTASKYVRNRSELFDLFPGGETVHDTVLGLFNGDHLEYNLDADRQKEPTIGEMTVAAIGTLKRGDRGYFLFVEGGRIDHAHHENKARKALDETVQFSEAIRLAAELVNLDDTLIVVTSDHAHTMSLSGYSKRGEDILGLNSEMGSDKLPYSTIAYGTGPRLAIMSNGTRANLSDDKMDNKDYVYPALVPMPSAAHGGDDVGVFAIGPWAHLFTGFYEQNVIPHFIAFAACLGDDLTACKSNAVENVRR